MILVLREASSLHFAHPVATYMLSHLIGEKVSCKLSKIVPQLNCTCLAGTPKETVDNTSSPKKIELEVAGQRLDC